MDDEWKSYSSHTMEREWSQRHCAEFEVSQEGLADLTAITRS